MAASKWASSTQRNCNGIWVHQGPGPCILVSLSESQSLFTIITPETENPLIFLQVRQSVTSEVCSTYRAITFPQCMKSKALLKATEVNDADSRLSFIPFTRLNKIKNHHTVSPLCDMWLDNYVICHYLRWLWYGSFIMCFMSLCDTVPPLCDVVSSCDPVLSLCHLSFLCCMLWFLHDVTRFCNRVNNIHFIIFTYHHFQSQALVTSHATTNSFDQFQATNHLVCHI